MNVQQERTNVPQVEGVWTTLEITRASVFLDMQGHTVK